MPNFIFQLPSLRNISFSCRGWGSSRDQSVFRFLAVFPKSDHADLALAASQGDVDETTGVLEALESTALGDLGLLLLVNL